MKIVHILQLCLEAAMIVPSCYPPLLQAHRGTSDELFAWDSREFLGKLCIKKVPGASESSIKNLPPSAIGDPSNLDASGLLAANKGNPMQAIVEQVCDGSTVFSYPLPEFLYAKVFIAGILAPSMGRRAIVEATSRPEVTADDLNGELSTEIKTQPTSAQQLFLSHASSTEVAPEPFGIEAKHFTEIHSLN